MPVLDHFSLEVLDIADFDAFHSQWASKIVATLNRTLPKGFRAKAHTSIGAREVDVRADKSLAAETRQKLIAQYQVTTPPIVSEVEFPQELEIFVDYIHHGKQLTVGVIEIISRVNKDRPGSRDSFVAKCSNLLASNVSLIIVDVLATPAFNLHNQLLESLEIKHGYLEAPEKPLYCAAYHQTTNPKGKPAVEFWRYALKIGDALPELPLFITSELAVPVNLEKTYMEMCDELKVFEE